MDFWIFQPHFTPSFMCGGDQHISPYVVLVQCYLVLGALTTQTLCQSQIELRIVK